jgi:crotonobetainyl-CoA:carnitine CoA-transferase CaiB-like acyl-CoA transferase
VQNSPECWADPQLAHRGHWVTVEHPVHERVVIENARVALSRTPACPGRGGPTLGEHNAEVLSGVLGYDDERIAELVIAGVLG